jgi:hypothetical protein
VHIDYTFHFWTSLSQGAALLGFGTFLYKTYRTIRELVSAAIVILDQHREMYGWFATTIKAKS